MSFRTRLTSFFVLIVVAPMIAVGALVFRLIGDSDQGKADARASGLASAAASLYLSESAQARADAGSVARQLIGTPTPQIAARVATLLTDTGLARIVLTRSGRTLAAAGARTAVAPGSARLQAGAGAPLVVSVSALDAPDLLRELTAGTGALAFVRQGTTVLASSLPRRALPRPLPVLGTSTVDASGSAYRVVTQRLPGFGGQPIELTTGSATSLTSGSLTATRAVAALTIGGFILLAFAFAILAARAIERQLRRFLEAARRLAGGDFSAPVPTEGNDEFAELGHEFNRMSEQLEERLGELTQERTRLRESLVRIGQTFASNLDRHRLLELALRTALEAVDAAGGRITVRAHSDEPLAEIVRAGDLGSLGPLLMEAERTALGAAGVGEAGAEDGVIALALGALEPGGRIRGLLTLVRPGRPFAAEDRELLDSLASQATLALENVELHFQVRRQAVTDELTGLANHGRFQDMLDAEMEQVRRYHHPLGLIMVDVDNFKSFNDTYGHQQGDIVLRRVAAVVRENSRDADTPARYGGEEMALILPHTDLDGAYAIAERVRSAIETLRIERTEGEGMLGVTASLGVAATSGDLERDELVAEADAALYRAKHAGKNRTERAGAAAAGVASGE